MSKAGTRDYSILGCVLKPHKAYLVLQSMIKLKRTKI